MTQVGNFGDRLSAACQVKGAWVCVGLDPVLEKLPPEVREVGGGDAAEAIERFSAGVLEATSRWAAAVKFQSACYERYGAEGLGVLERMMAMAGEMGLVVVLDAKRGDIGISSEHYAAAGLAVADAITVNAYLGSDAIEPFVRRCETEGKGVFVLVRTSNPGSDQVQGQRLSDGRTVGQMMADLVAGLGDRSVGVSGLSGVGAVVGATKAGEAAELRSRMPRQVFLVPGFGAQGGTIEDVRACGVPGRGGYGALVTASRSVIYAYEKGSPGGDWKRAVEAAAREMRDQLQVR